MPPALQVWSHTFCKEFDRLPQNLRNTIQSKIDEIGTRLGDYPHFRLTGRDEFRLRAGDYRVIYDFDIQENRIDLLYLGHRRQIYKRS